MQLFAPYLLPFYPPTLHSSWTPFLLPSLSPLCILSKLPSLASAIFFPHLRYHFHTLTSRQPFQPLTIPSPSPYFLPTLHSMQPAIRSMIPVRVKNSYNPSAVGTAITSKRWELIHEILLFLSNPHFVEVLYICVWVWVWVRVCLFVCISHIGYCKCYSVQLMTLRPT